MALKTITFTVGADKTLTPATVQDAGVQGDHKATELVFKFSDELYAYLTERGNEGTLVYRFDGYDGEGAVHHSDTAVLCERSVVYPLEYFLTRHGGLVRVELIISLVNDDVSDVVLHTNAAELKFIFSPYSTGDKSTTYADMAALVEVAKQCAERAERAEQAAAEAQAQTAQLAAAFKNGTTYIFNGGNASSEINADFIVDGEMSDYSHNAVKNKVIKAYVDGKEANMEVLAQEYIKKYTYPVGSVFTTSANENPAEKFGGEWELIDKEFIPLYKSIKIDESSNESNGFFKYSTKTMNSASLKMRRTGHSIEFTFKVGPMKDLNESDYATSQTYPWAIPVGDLELSNLGIENLAERENTTKIYFTGFSDQGRAVVMMSIDLYDGNIYIEDILSGINTDNNGSLLSGQDIVFSFGFNMLKENIIDSSCGKFYWRKTADVTEGE